MRLFQH
ncbi:hypothetical protein LINPERPRIM_LOCUS4343 [Linum perenne]